MNQRSSIDLEEFDLRYLQKTMQNLFSKRSDCATSEELEEVLRELKIFSITTKLEVRLFLKKHRRQLLSIDKTPLDALHQRLYREELGDDEYLDLIRRKYWFCYPALIRTAMEIEFGKRYEKFANERDEI